eukprot:SAG22_NODE_538_length_9344_cov_38.480368_2_plen_502_part_00
MKSEICIIHTEISRMFYICEVCSRSGCVWSVTFAPAPKVRAVREAPKVRAVREAPKVRARGQTMADDVEGQDQEPPAEPQDQEPPADLAVKERVRMKVKKSPKDAKQKARILELETNLRRYADANADLQEKNKALQDENNVLQDEVSRLERVLSNTIDEIGDAYEQGYDDGYYRRDLPSDDEEEEEEQEEEEQDDDKLREVLDLAASRGRWESDEEQKYVVEGCFRVLVKEIKVLRIRYTMRSIGDSLGVPGMYVANWVSKYPAGNPFRTQDRSRVRPRMPPREMKDQFEGYLTMLKVLKEAPAENDTREEAKLRFLDKKVPESFFTAYALLKETHRGYANQYNPHGAIYYDCWPNPGASVRKIVRKEVTRIQQIETWRKCRFLSKLLIWLHEKDADEFRRCTAIPWGEEVGGGFGGFQGTPLDPSAAEIYAERFQRHKEEFLGPFAATLREELGAHLPTSMLKLRALTNKISRREIDKTDDADDTRAVLIDMIVAAETPN